MGTDELPILKGILNGNNYHNARRFQPFCFLFYPLKVRWPFKKILQKKSLLT